MKNLIKKLQLAASRFSCVDFAIFKIYLFSVGILFGIYFAQFWFTYINIIWVVAVVSCIYVLVALYRLSRRE